MSIALEQPLVRTRLHLPVGLRAYVAAIGAVALAYLLMHLWRPVPRFPLDDPYITLHSAQVLHSGYDRNYPGVSPLFGATSAPFLGLVYLLLFIAKPLIAVDLACWVGVLLYVLGLVHLTRIFHLRGIDGALLIVLGLTTSFVPFHLLNGLETSLTLACVTWTLALASMEERFWVGAAAVAGLTASLRPDMLPFCGLIVAALTFEVHAATRSLKKTLIQGSIFAAVALLMLLPWAWWYYHHTGVPFPQTGLAKRYFMALDRLPWRAKLNKELFGLSIFMLTCGPLLWAFIRTWRTAIGVALLLFCGVFIVAVYIQFPTAETWNWFRYSVLLVPFMIWSLSQTAPQAHDRSSRTLGTLGMVSAIYILIIVPVSVRVYLHECRRYDDGLHEVASWCERNLPADATLLVHDAGYIAYATHFRTIDIVGLRTPSSIPINKQYVWETAGKSRGDAVAHIAAKGQGEYLILLETWPMMTALPEKLTALGWKVEPVKKEGTYRVFRLTGPGQAR